MSSAPETAPKSDRETNGQFAAGNRGGPGNPFARQVAELRQAILDRLTVESAGEIADALIAKAKTGDVAAARLLFQYGLGKPAKAVEPDRVEIEEHHLRMESTVPMTELAQPYGHVSVERVNDLSDVLRPIVDQQMLSPLAEGLKAMDGVPPEKQSKAAHKAMRRALRALRRGELPSPIGSDGGAGNVSVAGGSKGRADGIGPFRAG
jgi:hypothetical protein